MKDFVYQMPVKIYFGENGVEKYLKDELIHYGKNIMIAYGRGSVKRTGIYDDVVNVLRECGKNVIDFPNIPANPTYEKVLEGIKLYKENNVDLILAVGGGSVIDCCKIICAGTAINEDIWELELEKGIMTVPYKVFVPGVFDSLTHCMETYFGKTLNVSDLMNEGLMKDIVYNMKELINGNDTLEVRFNLMWDASLV